MFAALLDTCALYPSTCRDFLLSLAIESIYRPLWSSEILAELEEHETAKLARVGAEHGFGPDEAARRTTSLITAMEAAFPDARVDGWEPLEGTYGLPDPDDEHVLAAAVIGGAGVIVTWNLRDFPRDHVPAHIDIVPPEKFALDQVHQNPIAALRAVRSMAKRNTREPDTVDGILDKISTTYGMTETAQVIREVDRD